jgi:hypothetical protein
MSDFPPRTVLPSAIELRRLLAENREDAKLLRELLKITERADAEVQRRRAQDTTRFSRNEGGGP